MHTEIGDLRAFYRTAQGEVVRRIIAAEIRRFWADIAGLDLVGVGYAAPFVRGFYDEAARASLLMPVAQGALPWPAGRAHRTALIEEDAWPLREQSVDRLLLIHAIEPSEHLRGLMEEAFRVLKPMGQVMAVVPNRRGPWARGEHTPFGTGRPFSRGQLALLFEDHGFAVEASSHALFLPPYTTRFFLRSAEAWERTGGILWPAFSGVVVMVATKQILNPARVRRPFRLLQAIPELIPAAPRPTPN